MDPFKALLVDLCLLALKRLSRFHAGYQVQGALIFPYKVAYLNLKMLCVCKDTYINGNSISVPKYYLHCTSLDFALD